MKRKQSKSDKDDGFPVKHYSASGMVLFGANPILFKINQINRDYFDTNSSATQVLGSSFHKAMEAYYGGVEELVITSEEEAIEAGMKVGMSYLEMYNDGFINWQAGIPNKQKLYDKFTYLFQSYIKEMPYENGEELIAVEHEMKHTIAVKWRGSELNLPIPLKGFADKIYKEDGKLKIKDYKTCVKFSDLEKIDGSKMIQAVVYYLLVFAETGEEPYSMVYEEVKHTKNKDGSPQIRRYEMVFEENDQYFDFFFRYYEDITRALNGEMVYVPNVRALYDNEVSMVAYIHRLDMDEELAKQMKKHKVDNITDLLKKKVQSTKSMKKLRETIEKQFISAKSLNYSKMDYHERIKMKLMEHGMMLDFDSKVEGYSVDLYRYTPAIGLKMSKLTAYTADIEQVLGTSNIRILAPIPGTSLVGFEVPRKKRNYPGSPTKAQNLNVPIGMDIGGQKHYVDIKTAPHVLVAGTTGSGKSETLRSIIDSIGKTADFWIADPKGNEFHDIKAKRYAEDPEEIRTMLEHVAVEMDERYAIMKENGEREWSGKRIILLIDEFGDFILNNPKGVKRGNYDGWTKPKLERAFKKINPDYDCSNFKRDTFIEALTRHEEGTLGKYAEMSAEELLIKMAQKSRASGIHMIIATQSPRANVITGRIKANFPTRIALRTAGEIESRIILDLPGAEKLLGKGDLLLMRSDTSEIVRLQGFKI